MGKKAYIFEICEEIFQAWKRMLNFNKTREREAKDYEIRKWRACRDLMVQWMRIKQENHNLAEYLERYQCQKIAVYGLGDIGRLCCDEILQSGRTEIACILDQREKGSYRGIPIVRPGEIDVGIDAVIITPIYCYLEIAGLLCEYTEAKFISLEDMVSILNDL